MIHRIYLFPFSPEGNGGTGEGNFKIKITGLEENTFKNLQLTFQIGLHKDEIKTLEYIKNTLQSGHIS